MSAVWTVFRKEMRAYLVSPIPYVFAVLFTLFIGWYYFYPDPGFFVRTQADLGRLFGVLPITFVILVPGITMRTWSEEIPG